MPRSIEEPSPENPFVEVAIFKSNVVKTRSIKEDGGMVLFIPGREPDDRQRGEEDIIGSVQLKVVDLGAGEE